MHLTYLGLPIEEELYLYVQAMEIVQLEYQRYQKELMDSSRRAGKR